MRTVSSLKTVKKSVKALVEGVLADSGGLLRLAPCWVPRLRKIQVKPPHTFCTLILR